MGTSTATMTSTVTATATAKRNAAAIAQVGATQTVTQTVTQTTPTAAKKTSSRVMKVVSEKELAQHKTEDDLWVCIRGKIYDVSCYVNTHPGGRVALLTVAGRDCTGAFMGYHTSTVVENHLPRYQIGVLEGYSPAPMQEELIEIQAKLEAEGMFKYRPTYYLGMAAWLTALLAASLYVLYLARASATSGQASFGLYMLSAFLLGAFWQQLAYMGHDFGHIAVFHSRDLDWVGGLFVTLLFGVSGAWWRRSHNVHHVSTNSIEFDPDIQHLPVMAVSKDLLPGFYSHYYRRFFKTDEIAKLAVSYQHYLYIPVMVIARFNLYVQGVLLTLSPRACVRHRNWELAALAGFWVLFSALLSFVPFGPVMLCYVLLSHTIAAITNLQITLSHFGMPVYHGSHMPEADPRDAFVPLQFATTMNVECPAYLDWFHGGLQFQVEHHLLPRLPRHNLRYAKEKYIVPFARKWNIPYHSYYFTDGLAHVLGRLRDAARAAQLHDPSTCKSPVSSESVLYSLLNADG